MPNTLPANGKVLPAISRRLFIGGAAAASFPVTSVAVAKPLAPTIDEFLAKALPSERVRYHSNALMDAMAEMHPSDLGWRCQVDHETKFVLIVPRLPKREA